jgi:hypothetical protein
MGVGVCAHRCRGLHMALAVTDTHHLQRVLGRLSVVDFRDCGLEVEAVLQLSGVLATQCTTQRLEHGRRVRVR